MKRNGSGRLDLGDSAKRAKVDSGENAPSRVLFISSLPGDVTEAEVVQLGLPFGRMVAMILNKKKNQAFLEMSDLDVAESMVSYYTERPPKIGQRNVHVRYSNYEHLKMESNAQNAGCIAALKAADQLLEGIDEPKATLRIIIDNMLYPITIEILHKIFSKFGQVLRIVTFTKNNQFHAFVEYGNAIVATAAKNSLNGQNIYNGCCTLRVDYSKLDKLTVKYNNEKTWDFTNPNLPSGDGGHMSGDGLLGSLQGMTGMNMMGAGTMGVASGVSGGRKRLGGNGGGRDSDDFADNYGNNATGMGRYGGSSNKMSGMSGNTSGMSGMSGNMSGMAGNMGGLAGNMGGMAGNMGGLAGNLGGLAGNMNAFTGNMGTMAGNMGGMAGNMNAMAGNMGGMVGNLGMSGMAGNMGGMGGNMGLMAGNMGGMGGNMGGMLGNMAGMSGTMGGMTGGLGGVMGNMGSMAGNMGGMGGMAKMSGNMGNTSGIPSLLGNIPGMVGGMGGNMNALSGGNLGGMGGAMGGGLMAGVGNMAAMTGGMAGFGGMMSGANSMMGGGMMGMMGGKMGGGVGGMGMMSGKGGMDRGGKTGMSGMSGRTSKGDSSRKEDNRGDTRGSGDGCVVLVSNMDEKRITPDNVFTLFAVYGNVLRVKILFNKKDSALVEYADAEQAQFAVDHLNRAKWWGKEIRVSKSKHKHIMEAREGVAEGWLTKDFTNSPLLRFKTQNSKNFKNIFAPSATLHLSNIPPETTEDVLRDLFGEFGRVVAFKFFMKDRKMGLIQMSSVEEAISALVDLHNYELAPRCNLRVSFTQSIIKD